MTEEQRNYKTAVKVAKEIENSGTNAKVSPGDAYAFQEHKYSAGLGHLSDIKAAKKMRTPKISKGKR